MFFWIQVYDWVCFSQFLGKFQHLDKGVKSKISTQLFNKEGTLDEVVVQGTTETLNDRQRQQACTSSTFATQHTRLENMINDFTYYPGDYVFVNDRNRFGQVEALLVIDGCKWADLTIFDDHQRDQESGLMYANDNLQDIFELHQLSELSSSLVTWEQRHCSLV